MLCDHDSHRFAVHLDAGDLATVALAGAFMAPTRAIPADPGPQTPGVRVDAGTVLAPLGEVTGGVQRARYKGLFLQAEGWMAADKIDLAYEPSPADDRDRVLDGELIESVRLLDAPRGQEVARVERDTRFNWTLRVEKLAGPREGFLLVSFRDTNGEAVGWVPATAVRDPDKRAGVGGLMGRGGGGGSRPAHDRIMLPRATLLVGEYSGQILGVVTADADFVCTADCDTPRPQLSVRACTTEVPVRARR